MLQGCSRRGPAVRHRSTRRRQQLRTLCFSSSSDDLYSILSVPATATQAEIKAAYRRLVHDLHPDKHAHKPGQQAGATADAFARCKLAYEVLSDSEQRRQYDEALAAAGAAGAGGQGAAWSPYHGWMDAYGSPQEQQQSSLEADGSSPDTVGGQHAADYYQTLQQAAAATAAAGASSSGLSDYRDPLAGAAGAAGDSGHDAGQDSQVQQQSAAVRAALLDQHGIALEQFGSLADAVEALAERDEQQTLVGLAEGDYDNTWQL